MVITAHAQAGSKNPSRATPIGNAVLTRNQDALLSSKLPVQLLHYVKAAVDEEQRLHDQQDLNEAWCKLYKEWGKLKQMYGQLIPWATFKDWWKDEATKQWFQESPFNLRSDNGNKKFR